MTVFRGVTDEDRSAVQGLAKYVTGLSDVPGVFPWDPLRLWRWAMEQPAACQQARLVMAALVGGAAA